MGELLAALLALITATTGIDRPVDATLQMDAERRVIEIQESFSHDGLRFTEILAWNSGSNDPVASVMRQWRESPPHWAILSDPANTRIGCAVATTGVDVYWFACSFDQKVLLVALVTPPVVFLPPPIILPDTVVPNTAMERRVEVGDVRLLRMR